MTLSTPDVATRVAAGPPLKRELGALDGALITIGSIVGTGIFITTGDMARVLPHSGLLLLVWLAGGLLTLAGALTYAEMGALFPRAGGMYHFLKEAYGPLSGFLFGWACFLVIYSGGVAALATGFAVYLGAFLPFFSAANPVVAGALGSVTWQVSGLQLAAVLAVLGLTVVNVLGVREGAAFQNLLTALKIGAILALVAFGFGAAGGTGEPLAAPLPSGDVVSAFGVAMIAALWGYDGWYALPFLAGEMRRPARNLPLGLILGVAGVVLLYVLMNAVYAYALSPEEMAATPRIAETAAEILLGPGSARLVALAVLVSTFGCLSVTILAGGRIYLAMARDGLFFRALSSVNPRTRVPARSLWAQCALASLLALSGTYEQLYTYVTFAVVLFQGATGAAVFVLRRKLPHAPRPYRVWGYPLVPALFVLATLFLVWNTLVERPVQSLWGLGLIAIGLPAYAWWRRRGGGPGAGAEVWEREDATAGTPVPPADG
ncbi:MAG TPA: amino acid permease [Gemmatimonadota bacterium]